MKKYALSAVLTSLVMISSLASCGKKTGENAGSKKNAKIDGPVVSLSNTEASPGGVAEITLSVTGANEMWNMCGLHITYPEQLNCQMADPEEGIVKFHKGPASEESTAAISMIWRDGLPDELVEKHQKTLFFTEIFDGDTGLDGDIATFYFDVPENMMPGTYDVGFYVMDSDMFANAERNTAFQTVAFQNLQEGTITIK